MEPRVAWTDERIDDVIGRLDRRSDELRDEMREMRTEMRTEMRDIRSGLTADLGGRIDALRTDMSAWQRQQAMVGWGIAAALLAQLVAFVITQS